MKTESQFFQRRTRRKPTVETGGIAATLAGRQYHPDFPNSSRREALRRLSLLQRYHAAREQGSTASSAAIHCGASAVTLWRYLRALEAGGLPALAPQTHRCGRHSIAEDAGLTPKLIDFVRSLAVAVGSSKRAWKLFAESSLCPPRLARKIRRSKTLSKSLLKLLPLRNRTVRVRECAGWLLVDVSGGSK